MRFGDILRPELAGSGLGLPGQSASETSLKKAAAWA